MKSIVISMLMLSAVILSSCSTIPGAFIVDYRKYDIFITESPVPAFDYKPIAHIQTDANYWTISRSPRKSAAPDDIYGEVKGSSERLTATTSDRAMERLVEIVKELGGDAVIGVQYHYIPNSSNQVYITGMVVKRMKSYHE